MPIFSKKDKAGNLSCNFAHIEGVPGIGEGTAINVTQDDTNRQLAIAMRMSKAAPKYLPYSQIDSVGVVSQKEIQEHSKNVVGRAVVGKLLFGSLGAIVGGLSGTGTKQIANTRYYFILNYHPAQFPNDIRVISFEIIEASLHWDKFVTELKLKIPQKVESQYL